MQYFPLIIWCKFVQSETYFNIPLCKVNIRTKLVQSETRYTLPGAKCSLPVISGLNAWFGISFFWELFWVEISLFHICCDDIFPWQVNYEASGWVSHQVTDLWAKTSPDAGDPMWALWPMGGPWLATHLWEHYSYTMDKVSNYIDK